MAGAKAAGSALTPLKIGLGSDWSPTGSKNLFGELKVARAYSQSNGNIFGDEELVRLATSAGAEILGWEKVVGSIEVDKRADLLVIAGQADGAPYAQLFAGDERQVQLVAINGTPRYGTQALMVADGPGLELLTVGGEQRVLYLKQETEDPDVAALSLAQARSKLADALQNIKELRLAQEAGHPPETLAEAPRLGAGQPRLALDEFERTDFTQRPHLPLEGIATGPTDRPAVAARRSPRSSRRSPWTPSPSPTTRASWTGWRRRATCPPAWRRHCARSTRDEPRGQATGSAGKRVASSCADQFLDMVLGGDARQHRSRWHIAPLKQ